MNMLVSVVIPNYNHAQFLTERIESILNQSYESLELIILDDHSGDNSREVIDTYRSHPKISQIVYNETNSGSVFVQWIRGIGLAKGELIWIAESDDSCEPSFLQEMIGHFEKHPQLVIAFAQSIIFDSEQRILWKTEAEYLEEYLDGTHFLEKYMLGRCSMVNASAVLFRKEAFQKISDTFTSYRQCGDWRFWCEIAEQGDVVISGKYLNYFRKHNANTTSRHWMEGLYYLEGSEIIKYLIQRHSFSEAVIEEQLSQMLQLLEKERDIYDKELYQRIMDQLQSIHPKVISEIQGSLNRQRQKEQIKNLIRKAINK